MPNPPHPTASYEEVDNILRCGPARAAPLFIPAIYEHKAWFVGSTPSAISRDPDLLTRALLAEYETIRPDSLTVGVDVYNIEAESVGCDVTFYEGNDTSIPGIKPGDHFFHVGDDLAGAPLPNPLTAGRMPVNLAAARNVRRVLGDDFWVRGAIAGPFSLATSLVGADDLFIACLEDPDWVRGCLDYASRITKEYAKAYIDAGAKLIIFDSQASPALLSPQMYEELVFPVTRDFVAWVADEGVRDVPLVIGGNTTSIAPILARTGANNLLCDFTGDLDRWAEVARESGRALRRNISPHLIENGTPDQIYAAAAMEIHRGREIPGFILGTGVIPFGTPTQNLLAIKRACLDAAEL